MNDIQRRPEPTRDVYVTRRSSGEREFVGFGREADEYADCHIDPATLPVEKIQVKSNYLFKFKQCLIREHMFLFVERSVRPSQKLVKQHALQSPLHGRLMSVF